MATSDDNTITLTVETFSNKKHLYVFPRLRVPSRRDLFCWQYALILVLAAGLISFSMWLSMSLFWREALRSQLLSAYEEAKNPFTFDDIFNSSFQPKSFVVHWMKDVDGYTYKDSNGAIAFYDVTTNTSETIMEASEFKRTGASKFYVSDDLQFILLARDIVKKWRHSFSAKYQIYRTNIGNSNQQKVLDFPNFPGLRGKRLQFAGWSPGGHRLSFVYNNDLFSQSSPDSNATRLTTTGQSEQIFNGYADWLYEEEILLQSSAHWWSPDGALICYAVFNDTLVPHVKFPFYGPSSDVYGHLIDVAYPKAGDLTPGQNTRVTLYVTDTADVSSPHVNLEPPRELVHRDHYLTQVVWRDARHVTVEWTNRRQTETFTFIYDVFTGESKQNYHRVVDDGWIDPSPQLYFIDGGASYLRLLSRNEGVTGSWRHLAILDVQKDTESNATFLTQGEYDVKRIVGYDNDNKLIYYISTNGDPKKRHLFRVGTPAANSTDWAPVCLSCDEGDQCQYVTARMSASGRFYVLACLGPGVPRYTLVNHSNNTLLVLEDNEALSELLATKDLPTKEFIKVPIGGGYSGWAQVTVPPPHHHSGFRKTKHPLLVHTYGGPGSQRVSQRFTLDWSTYMASSRGVVIASLDSRGTASRGDRYLFQLYRRLGTREVEDQLLGGSYFKEKLPYVDASKSAIWGWSYGGFLSLHALANESNVFQCGIAGAPLSDRRYYDTAHSERFMGFAGGDDNQSGYERASVLNKVEHFRNRTLLLIHGTADDNVHFASSAQLISALIEAEIQFRVQVYPDLNHYFVRINRHLARLMTDFLFNECWARKGTY